MFGKMEKVRQHHLKLVEDAVRKAYHHAYQEGYKDGQVGDINDPTDGFEIYWHGKKDPQTSLEDYAENYWLHEASEEEVDEALRSLGLDPVEVGRRGKKLAERLLKRRAAHAPLTPHLAPPLQ